MSSIFQGNIFAPCSEHPPVVDPDAAVAGACGQMVGHEGVQGDRGHRVRGTDQDVLRAVGLGAPVLIPETNVAVSP